MKSPFRIAVITDEITQDLGRALEIVAREFGMDWVELRGMWSKNVLRLDAKEIAEARRLLEQFRLRVTNIASPLFKVDWPGAPRSEFSPQRLDQFAADFTFAQQDEVLERSIELARVFRTDRVRCFDFWRLEDPAPHRSAMDEALRNAAEVAGRKKVVLALENEYACNTSTAAEAQRTLSAVRSPHLKLNWDPGNAAMRGETPYPDGYNLLPKNRIAHVHCKNVEPKRGASGMQWAAMGRGTIDWTGQFRALRRDGYRLGVSLETHWRGAGSAEESSRQCWREMREQLQKAGALS
jgi:sugar phosphate isomerase/epimerase